MKQEPKGNKILVCWTCKKLGHYSSKSPNRVKKLSLEGLTNQEYLRFAAMLMRMMNSILRW